MKKIRGFTLIELLVVVSIAAIVAAILFPVFYTAREKARQATCVSNIRQIGMAMMMYIGDNDERFPKVQYQSGADYFDWSNEIHPYITNAGVMQTGLSGEQISYGEGGVYSCPSAPGQEPMEYGMNKDLGGAAEVVGFTTGIPQNVAIVATPADTVLLLEKGHMENPGQSWPYFETLQAYWCGPLHVGPDGTPPPGAVPSPIHYDLLADYDEPFVPSVPPPSHLSFPGDMPRYRHNGTCTVAFCDGHVKAMHRGSLDWYTNIYVQGAYYQSDPTVTIQ